MRFHHVDQNGLNLLTSWFTRLGLPKCWDYRMVVLWWELHWICRLLLEVWSFSQYWFYPSISMGCVSVCVINDLFQQCFVVFLNVIFSPWLNISLGIYFTITTLLKGIKFLNCFLTWWLLLYRSATNLYTLILFPETLLNSFIRSRSCFWMRL